MANARNVRQRIFFGAVVLENLKHRRTVSCAVQSDIWRSLLSVGLEEAL